ncbi:hypothetical protein OH460_08010 [Vibrio sp. Makdt]|uniref:hypothetical protein n=1 Tax=Vibrio sp. Makdt TaxID=2998828 RepID=UPI0022CDAF08|nr:hypothetical protein [Vibrio sp. Makdt]MDA0152242.1 hypothetical protein [Vibrio sp. Makdt]
MRIPILKTDLSEAFNSVAKYLGRHWPEGKLKHNQSRELLSKLMGYNDTHEVYETAELNTLPDMITLDSVVKAMLVRSLKFSSSNPVLLHKLLTKLPYKKLAFYTCTTNYKLDQLKEQAKRSNKVLVLDEFHSHMNYTSPKIYCDVYDQNLIPKYRQAVRRTNDGYEVFDQSRVETLSTTFDNLPSEVLEEQGITNEAIIANYIAPHIWYSLDHHIDKMMVNQEWDLPHCYNVFIAYTSKSADTEPVYLIGKGVYEAVVPRIYSTANDVYQGIATLLKGQPIEPQSDRLPTLYNVRACFSPKHNEHDHFRIGFEMAEANQDLYQFTLHGQALVKIEPVSAFPEGWQDAIDYQPTKPKLFPNMLEYLNDVIPTCIAEQSLQISRQALTKVNSKLIRLDKLSQSQWQIMTKHKGRVSINYESKDIERLRDEDFERDEYKLIGQSVEKQYPEIEGVFDSDVLGVLYISSEQDHHTIYYSREDGDELPICYERNTRFLVSLCAGLLTDEVSYFADDKAYQATIHVLTAWIFNVEWNFKYEWSKEAFEHLSRNIKIIRRTIAIQENIDRFIKSLLMHEGTLQDRDEQYTYHSTTSEPKRNSDNYVFTNFAKRFRKTSILTQNAEQLLNDSNKPNEDKESNEIKRY